MILKKLFYPFLPFLLLTTSCNKNFNKESGDPNAATKTMVVSANSSNPIKVHLLVTRPDPVGVEQIESVDAAGVGSPYSFTSDKIKVNDGISVLITSATSDAVTASLTIAGVNIPPSGTGFDTHNLYYVYWDTTSK